MPNVSGRAALSLLALLLAGCASVQNHLSRSMQDSYIASEACSVVNGVVETRPEDVKSEVVELAEELLGLASCTVKQENGETTLDCAGSLYSYVADVERELQSLLSQYRGNMAAHEKRVAEIRQTMRQISNRVFTLRADIRAALDSLKPDALSGTCKAPAQCMRDFRVLIARVMQVADRHLYELNSDVGTLTLSVEQLLGALAAEQNAGTLDASKLAKSIQALSGSIAQRTAYSQRLAADQEWHKALEYLAYRVGLQQAGRLTVRMFDRGTQSVDRVLDKVDEKAWFVASLAMAVYEADIRDILKNRFIEYYVDADKKVPEKDKTTLRNITVAFVFAACEQLATATDGAGTASTPATGRGGYLLYPLFTAAVGALYEHLMPEEAKKFARVDSETFRTNLTSWIGTKDFEKEIRKDGQQYSIAKANIRNLMNAKREAVTVAIKELVDAQPAPKVAAAQQPKSKTAAAQPPAPRVVIPLPNQAEVQAKVENALAGSQQ